MRTLLVLLRKDTLNFLRNRTAFSLTFIVPIALIYIFGHVFGLNKKKDDGPSGIWIGVVNASSNPGAQKLIDALKAEPSFRVVTSVTDAATKKSEPLTEATARQRIQAGDFRFALVIPEDVLPEKKIGLHLVILSDPRNEIETQMVNGLLQKTIFTSVPQLLGQSLQQRAKAAIGERRLEGLNRGFATALSGAFGGDPAKIQEQIAAGNFVTGVDAAGQPGDAAAPANFLNDVVHIETKQVVGQNVKSPQATRVVGGWAIMFLLFAVSGSSAAFFDEKNAGLFQRLLSAPVRRAQLLWSRFLFGILLGLVQLTAMFAAGQLLYGIDVTGHLGLLIVTCTAAAAACTSFGMLIAAFAPNPQAASGLATFFVMVMSATGGAWFPISLMPAFMQQVGKLTIVYWSMEGFAQVLWAGNTLAQLLPTLAILVAVAGGVMALAVWRINRKPIFG